MGLRNKPVHSIQAVQRKYTSERRVAGMRYIDEATRVLDAGLRRERR